MLLTLSSDDFLDLAGAVLRRGQPLRFRAAGASMSPFIRPGDVLIADPVDGAMLRQGDVALYRSERGPRAHRVVRRTRSGFQVQGDAPGCLPEQVAAADILGRITSVERGGGRIPLDRGAARLMRWRVARVPGGRRLARSLGGWAAALGERRGRDSADLLRALRLCSPWKAADAPLPDSEWERLAALAGARDLAPLLYARTRGQALPPAAARDLARAYYVSAARCAVLSDAVGKALRRFREAGVPALVLKGVALSETVYPGPACRPMTDVDLLVRPQHLRDADRVLAGLGYRPVDGRAEEVDPFRPAPLSTLDYQAGDPLLPPVHLHWHLVNTSIPTEAYRGFIDMDEVWDAALPLSAAGTETLCLAPHHLLVYLCEHALRPAHAFYKPLHLTDLAQVIAQGPDWGRVTDAAQRFRLGRMAGLGLRIVRDLMDAPVPDEVLETLRPARLTRGERLFLRQTLKGRARPGLSVFVHLALRPTIRKKVRFIAGTLFPARAVAAHHAPDRPWKWVLRRGRDVLQQALSAVCRLPSAR